MLIRKHRAAHTLERAIEREDLAKQGSETLLHRPLADIRDPRRAASPRQMQRSRIPLSSLMSVCVCRLRTDGASSARSMCMLMTAMEREQKLEGGAVAIGVEVGVGELIGPQSRRNNCVLLGSLSVSVSVWAGPSSSRKELPSCPRAVLLLEPCILPPATSHGSLQNSPTGSHSWGSRLRHGGHPAAASDRLGHPE